MSREFTVEVMANCLRGAILCIFSHKNAGTECVNQNLIYFHLGNPHIVICKRHLLLAIVLHTLQHFLKTRDLDLRYCR